MEKLYLSDEDGSNALHLHGSQIELPVVGAHRQDQARQIENGLVEEVIDVALQGAGIQSIVQELEERIALSRSRVHDAWLFLQAEGRGAVLSTRVMDGRIELLGGGLSDRARNVQSLRIYLIHGDYWEEFNRALHLSNQNGSDVWDGLPIRNHCDSTSGHQNFVDAPAEQVGGAQSCPLEVRLILPAGFGSTLQDCYIAAGFDLVDAGGSFNHVLEGEQGAPGSGSTDSSAEADSGSSAGFYQHIEWTGQDETPIWKWTIDPTRLNYMKGRLFRPIMRLASPPASGIYLRWSVANQTGVGETLRTHQVQLDPAHVLAALPALRLPPDPMGGGPYEPLEIQLLAECAVTGTKSLDIDFVQLLPGGAFQHLHPLGGLSEGSTLVSDGRENKVYSFRNDTGGQSVTHGRTGSPILAQPGRNNRIYILFETDAGAPVDALAQVMIYQQPRWRQP